MIRLENVHVDYGEKKILNGIDAEIRAGEFVSIVGQTGCGKSTLLRLILAEEMPSSGRVLVSGFHISCKHSPPLSCYPRTSPPPIRLSVIVRAPPSPEEAAVPLDQSRLSC